MRGIAALALCALACVTAAPSPSLPPHAAPPPRDCPDGPAIELYALAGEALGEAFAVGGHIVTLEEDRDDEGRASLVGTLDVKGALALARSSRAEALASYAETQRGRPAHRMALALRGVITGSMELTSALRGSRFRVPATLTREDAAALRDALRVDRRCFPGR